MCLLEMLILPAPVPTLVGISIWVSNLPAALTVTGGYVVFILGSCGTGLLPWNFAVMVSPGM